MPQIAAQSRHVSSLPGARPLSSPARSERIKRKPALEPVRGRGAAYLVVSLDRRQLDAFACQNVERIAFGGFKTREPSDLLTSSRPICCLQQMQTPGGGFEKHASSLHHHHAHSRYCREGQVKHLSPSPKMPWDWSSIKVPSATPPSTSSHSLAVIWKRCSSVHCWSSSLRTPSSLNNSIRAGI